MTTERVSYAQVERYSTYLLTALVKDYGLKEGDAVVLFSPNTIWYPVAMLGTLRAGMPLPKQLSVSSHKLRKDCNSRRSGLRRIAGVQC